jgi:hypothetical protein
VAASATEGFFSRRWVADNIFGMSHEEFQRNQREMYYDRSHDASLQAVAEGGAQEGGALGGGLGGDDLGADLGGDLDAELGGDLGGPEEIPAGSAGADAAPEAGEESSLLAVPPGSRKEPRLTPGAKGKVYNPVTVDKRSAGARQRSNAAKYSKEKASSTKRNVYPGAEINTIPSIGNGIYEQDRSIYSLREQSEEENLFQINESVRSLIEGLENKNLLTEQKDEDKA